MIHHLIKLAEALGDLEEANEVVKLAEKYEIPSDAGRSVVDFDSNPLVKAIWNYAEDVASVSYKDESLRTGGMITSKEVAAIIHLARQYGNDYQPTTDTAQLADKKDQMHPDNFRNLVFNVFNLYFHQSEHELDTEVWLDFMQDIVEYYGEEYFDSYHDELAYAKKMDQWFEEHGNEMSEEVEALLYMGRLREKNKQKALSAEPTIEVDRPVHTQIKEEPDQLTEKFKPSELDTIILDDQ